jgi:hypothetical protein
MVADKYLVLCLSQYPTALSGKIKKSAHQGPRRKRISDQPPILPSPRMLQGGSAASVWGSSQARFCPCQVDLKKMPGRDGPS